MKLISKKVLDIVNGDVVSMELVQFLMIEPHYRYESSYVEDFFEHTYNEGVIIWLSEKINEGLLGHYDPDIPDEVFFYKFKIHKVGKNGRMIRTYVDILNTKDFFNHYDNFVAEYILLGLGDTQTDSKD